MCRYRGDDGYSPVSRSKTVKARKEHRCEECCRQIQVGETARYDFTVYEGNAYSIYTCEHCAVGTVWLSENCGGWGFGEVVAEIQEHADEYPSLALPLLRYTVAARRKWKRFKSDDLLPVPALMPSIASYVLDHPTHRGEEDGRCNDETSR